MGGLGESKAGQCGVAGKVGGGGIKCIKCSWGGGGRQWGNVVAGKVGGGEMGEKCM